MTTVRLWSREELEAGRDELLDVYAEAMDVHPVLARSRRPILLAHLNRRGLRSIAAYQQDQLVGISYGYLGDTGQWWHDRVREALTEDAARDWLDGSFEVCELHVRPAHQGTGLGRQLLLELLADQPARTAVLSTPDRESRARAFYRAGGWVDLVRALVFPGDPREFAVLGLRLPPKIQDP